MMRSAIVGCGAIAKLHAGILEESSFSQIIAVADCRADRARELAEESGHNKCRYYDSLEEMCDKEEIDVLHICTPHYLHVPMAIYALERGISVFMEKPPAITREQFIQLQEAEQKAKQKAMLGICFQNRYNDSVKALYDMLHNSELGKVIGAKAYITWNRTKEYYEESDWRGRKALEGGGALINQTIHTLDLLVQFLGKPLLTKASMHNRHLSNYIEVEDTVDAYMEFGEIPVLFYGTTAYSTNSPVMIEVECEKAVLRMEGSEITKRYPNGDIESIKFHKGYTMGKDYWGTGHKSCITDFYQCLLEGKEFPVGLSHVRNSFELMMDIYQSAKEGRVVYFDKSHKLSGFADEIDPDMDKQIEVLKECDISYMELRSAYNKNISEYTLKEAKQLKLKLDEAGIRVSAIGSPIGKISITEEFEEHFQLFTHVVELAKLFETKYIRIFSFYIPQGEIQEKYKGQVLARMARMIAYAKKEGVILLHENEKGIYGDNALRCHELMDGLYGPNFKLIFDFANFVQCNENTLEAYKLLKPYLAYVHVKDALKNTHQVVPAGMGDGHIAEIVKNLSDDGFTGFFSLEPHLFEFSGLKQLEREEEQTIRKEESTNGRDAFLIAAKAFKNIIN